MSFEDLETLVNNVNVDPPAITEPTSIDEMPRDNIEAISAQQDIESRFNNPLDLEIDAIDVQRPFDPSEPPIVGDAEDTLTSGGTLKDFSFAVGYASRLTRSALAISGATATAERFGDVRKSQGFWVAMTDVLASGVELRRGKITPGTEAVLERTRELTRDIPALLTDPETPEGTIPSVGRLFTAPFPELEPFEWIYTLIGELVIEANVLKATKTLASKGMSKLTRGAYEAGPEIVKKKGIARLLGQLDDEEMRAIDEAVRFRRVGKLGTKPPQPDIDDAMRRTFEYIDESKPSQLVKKEVISAKRKEGAARMYAIQGDDYGPGYSRRMRKAGAATTTDKSFTPLNEVSSIAANDERVLQKVIDNHDFGGSKIYTTANSQDALAKLYEFGELLTPGDVENLRDVFGSEFADSLDKFILKPEGVAGKLFEAGRTGLRGLNATSRTLTTTGELSFLLRQANYRAWSRPADAIRSWSVANRSLISPKYADKIDEALRFTRAGKIGTENGLFLGRWRDVKSLSQREEVFMAEWLDKVPIIGRLKKGFERGYVNGLNQVRVDWYDEGLQLLENTGKDSPENLKKWAAYVNNMTGRADLDAIPAGNQGLIKMANIAKDTLFAPRFTASKWNRHKVAAEIMFGKDTPNAMRRMLAEDAVTKWRRYERLAHYYTQNGGTVETNPQSSDYLKLKAGDTRIDVLGGDSQVQVALVRIASGQTKDLATGLLKDTTASAIATQYISGKLNPLWSLIIDKSFGRTFDGQDIDDPEVLAKVIRDKFIPFYLSDLKDKVFNEYEEQGKSVADSLKGTLTIAAAGFPGAGITTFAPSARKKYELMVEDKAQELHAKHYDELPLYLKREVLWEAENDDIDKTELLKEEMGMTRQTRATSARLTKIRNKSFRQIRKGLGNDFNLFEDSNIPVREFGIDLGGIRLSTEQHEFLSKLYVKKMKEELAVYPDIKALPPLNYERRRWLEDIESNAREDAIFELEFAE